MSTAGVKRKHSKKLRKNSKVISIPDDEELQYLEKIVLGRGADVFDEVDSEEDSDNEISQKKGKQEEEVDKKPAWVDEDDNVTFDEVVRKQGRRCRPGISGSKDYQTVTKNKYQEVMGVPKWSKIRKSESEMGNLLNSCGNFIKKAKFLESGLLEFKKLRNLNCRTRVEGSFIQVVKFHPKSIVGMIAGVSGMVSLVQVDGKENTKLQTLKFENFPIHCGSFLKNGEQFLIGSRHYKYFYCHDLMTGKSVAINNSKLVDIANTRKFVVSPNDDFIALTGKHGQIFLLSALTKEFIDTFQMNCNVTALSFSYDGSFLYSHGVDGEVYIWDMKSRTCVKKFFDDGCLAGTSICISNNDQFIACGSSSGIVNIYDCKSVHSGDAVLPIKTIYNLVTAVTDVQFNPSSEILAFASRDKENALKLLHCPSMTAFSNFPHFQSDLKKPLCMDFSPNGGFFGVGDSNGRASLYRLKYYGNY